jgi:hypothetical protein
MGLGAGTCYALAATAIDISSKAGLTVCSLCTGVPVHPSRYTLAASRCTTHFFTRRSLCGWTQAALSLKPLALSASPTL